MTSNISRLWINLSNCKTWGWNGCKRAKKLEDDWMWEREGGTAARQIICAKFQGLLIVKFSLMRQVIFLVLFHLDNVYCSRLQRRGVTTNQILLLCLISATLLNRAGSRRDDLIPPVEEIKHRLRGPGNLQEIREVPSWSNDSKDFNIRSSPPFAYAT